MKNDAGFTMIELLIVIAVIGILASMIGASTIGVRVKARNQKRIADMKALVVAQEMYYSDMTRYYTCSATAGDCSPGSPINYPSTLGARMPATPLDPKNGGACGTDYIYCGLDNTADNQQFCYYAKLEQEPAVFYTAAPMGSVEKDAVPTDFADCSRPG